MYQVIAVNCITHEIEVLHTTTDYNEAIAFLNKHVDEAFALDSWIKCTHDNQKSVSIYQYFRVWSKQLVSKIHIVEFARVDA